MAERKAGGECQGGNEKSSQKQALPMAGPTRSAGLQDPTRPVRVRQIVSQQFRDLSRGSESVGRTLGLEALDSRGQPRRNGGVEFADRLGRRFADLAQDGNRGAGGERLTTGTEGV